MSKLDELIAKLCPNGVECKPLSEIATITRGGSLQKKDFTESGVPCIHYGQIYTKYGLFTDKTFTFVSEATAIRQKKAVTGDIVMAVTSENIEDVCKCVVWLGEEDVAVSGHTAIIHHNQDAKYLAYYFHSSMFFAQKAKLAHGTKVIEVTPDKLNGVIVPVPPLEVQREIVRVLDNFTFLSAELSAELSARRKQYDFYLNSLLDLESLKPSRVMYVGDLFEIKNGLNKEKTAFGKGTPIVNFTDVYNKRYLTGDMLKGRVTLSDTEITRYEVKKGDVLFTRTSETKEDVGMSSTIIEDIPYCTFSGFVLRARPLTDLLSPKFCAYYFSTNQVRDNIVRYASFTTRATTSGPKLAKIPVPIISIEEQERVVSILDRFDILCNDLSAGIPAEIEARKKQYEYYRDKLLSFKEIKK